MTETEVSGDAAVLAVSPHPDDAVMAEAQHSPPTPSPLRPFGDAWLLPAPRSTFAPDLPDATELENVIADRPASLIRRDRPAELWTGQLSASTSITV
ncbi:hypothetical protein OG735_24030 [Streptomyces sp. NBC_01210]|uniref:hypothetical protein n=1 Tax=Streptomyces sp. NBC_01210 TaxID=2903774 RepID=UPI002E0ED766|nr:hypothetical protein OG735_24030 [Streptomyces sp. NBC_01210]